jgi:lipid II:glycine glycyltransferase (peptidoglycan interpeptide bridge formation enzyme)
MRPASEQELKNWDELVALNPDGGNVLQLKEFGQVKQREGWLAKHYMLGETAILGLSRQLRGLGEFLYIPRGPGLAGPGEFSDFVKPARQTKAFLIKIDPEIKKELVKPGQFRKLGLVPGRDIQLNNTTILVDLRPSEAEILASFKQKTRYNIRLAERKGVDVAPVPTTAENINALYDMASETYSRAGVYVRSKDYFADFWLRHADSGHGQMFFARYEGQLLAGAFITYVGRKGLYKDGASYREHSDVQAPYALQWGVMKWLKSHNITEYDLHSVPPLQSLHDPKHPLAGLVRFKTGFNQEVTEYVGTYDLPLKSAKYWAWTHGGERAAMAYEHRVKNRLFY